ncbi:MAG: hypothetical protein LBQ60_14135 [Bacteroidales bacterium]|nr:hypothetical protein [Bacteroidales bacterium]
MMRVIMIVVCIFFIQGCSFRYPDLVINNIIQELKKSENSVEQDTANIENKHNRVFIDTRDGRSYRIVKIGNQMWMAQNLAYKPKKGKYWCYINDEIYISEFGYVYRWKTAMEKDICPCGWRLPSPKDYEILLDNFGGMGLEAHERLIITGDSGFNGVGSYGRGGAVWIYTAYLWTTEKGIAFTFGDKRPDRENFAKIVYSLSSGGLPVRCIKDE